MAGKKYKNGAIIGTILFHGLIVALLLLAFKAPVVEEEDGGILVNFGTDAAGSGTEEPQFSEALDPSEASSNDASENTDEEVLSQDDESDFEVPDNTDEPDNTTSSDNNQNNEHNNEQIVERQVNDNMLFRNNGSETNNNQGNDNNANGNKGNPNGDPNSNNYDGTGLGNGVSGLSLKGRTPEYLQPPSRDFQEEGIVVVKVYVDKNGNVTRAKAGEKGTNVPEGSKLLRLAEKAALGSKFSKKMDGAIEQVGTITYTFRLH